MNVSCPDITGAVDEYNSMPYYAELCSAMLAVTYSNGHSHGDRMIVSYGGGGSLT